MITGRSSGSGKYTFQARHSGNRSCMVAMMPEDEGTLRVTFKNYGQTQIPVMTLSRTDAILLWSALNAAATDLNFNDDILPKESK